MENRPVGRQKRVVSGGTGVKRSGEGLGKQSSQRDSHSDSQLAERKARGFFSALFRRK